MAASLPAELNKLDPTEAWKPWTPTADEPWDRKRAAHLFRRGAFGASPADLEKALTAGFPKTLDSLLKGEPDAVDLTELLRVTGDFFDEPANIRTWWLYGMINGGHPLREKMTLFWHNHFATSYAKIRSSQLMYEQNLTLRKYALGKFRPFLLDMSKDTAMLVWLDSNRNVKGAPNENFAREVMELFSLGVGNYSEKDIQEAARAFTGWHHNITLTAFENNPSAHDEGEKTVLGQKGAWTGSDIIRICCDQPACARFLIGKLYSFLVSETPPPKGLLTPLEERFRKSDYNIADLVSAMLGSRLFFSSHAYRKRVKWPVEYVLESYHAITPGSVPPSDFVAPLAKMGQVLFSPPNVKGWRTGTDWLNSATLLARNNFAEVVALGEWSRSGETPQTGGRPVKKAESSASTIPPPPAPAVDPVVTLYTTKPKDIPALVARMSELLYGDQIAPTEIAKIDKFLHEPLTPPKAKSPDPQPKPKKDSDKVSEKNDTATATTTPKPLVEEPKETKQEPKKPVALNMDSPEFKARVREALHAMMCLPEYQLN
jgi:hypothetical protein